MPISNTASGHDSQKANASTRVAVVSFLLAACLPAPLFFDIHSRSLVDKFHAAIPMPIGLLALVVLLALYYALSFANPASYTRWVTPRQSAGILALSVMPFVVFATIVAELSPIRSLQLLMPIFIACMLTQPNAKKTQDRLLQGVLFGGGGVYTAHLYSLWKNNNSLMTVPAREFVWIGDQLLYQGLVTYPAVAVLYIFVSAFVLGGRRHSLAMKTLAAYVASAAVVIVLIAGRRASLIEMALGAIAMLAGASWSILAGKAMAMRYVCITVAVSIAVWAFWEEIQISNLSGRLETSFERGISNDSRLSIYDYAIDTFKANPYVFLFGSGGTSAVGFHNYLLDTLYRVGVVGLAVILAPLSLICCWAFSRLVPAKSDPDRLPLAIAIASSVAIQSTFNSSVTQPYYVANLVIVAIIASVCVFPRAEAS